MYSSIINVFSYLHVDSGIRICTMTNLWLNFRQKKNQTNNNKPKHAKQTKKTTITETSLVANSATVIESADLLPYESETP